MLENGVYQAFEFDDLKTFGFVYGMTPYTWIQLKDGEIRKFSHNALPEEVQKYVEISPGAEGWGEYEEIHLLRGIPIPHPEFKFFGASFSDHTCYNLVVRPKKT